MNKPHHLAKMNRIINDSILRVSSELIEIDATNQVFHLLGLMLKDETLSRFGGGVFDNNGFSDAYSSLGDYLKTKIDTIIKDRLGKKAKKAMKKASYTKLFERANMKPLVMPLVYGKGIRSSLYGTVEQQDSTVGFGSAKSSNDIYEIHNELQKLEAQINSKTAIDEVDLSHIPLYWGLQGVAWDCISKDELETIYINAINTLFPKLLETMKLLQQAFLTSKGQADAVAFNLFGVSGLIQRKNKLDNVSKFINSKAIEKGDEAAYTVERTITSYIGGRAKVLHYTPYYNRNSNSATNVTPALMTNVDSTLVRLVFLATPLEAEMFQVYDAFYISPIDYSKVIYSYKMGLRLIAKQKPLETIAKQLGGGRVIVSAIKSKLRGSVTNTK